MKGHIPSAGDLCRWAEGEDNVEIRKYVVALTLIASNGIAGQVAGTSGKDYSSKWLCRSRPLFRIQVF